MTRDYYAESRGLGVDLWEAGYGYWSEKIDAIIDAGATSGEILMGLRWTLSELGVKENSLPADLRQRAESLRKEIDRALS